MTASGHGRLWGRIRAKSARVQLADFADADRLFRGVPEAAIDRLNDGGAGGFQNKVRHIATRYDKLAANYLAFIQPASIRPWLRVYESVP